MKRNLLFAGIMALICFCSFVGTAQTPRVQLFEYFDDDQVPTAGIINHYFDGLEHANTGKMISIKYHVDLGSGGFDTLYLENPVQSQLRFADTYDLFQIPSVVQDGGVAALQLFSGVPYNVYQPSVDTREATTSPFSISVSHALNVTNDSMLIHAVFKQTGAASGTFYEQVVVIEKEIHFSSAPGPSGDVNFANVFKYFLPSAMLPAMNIGDSTVIDLAWQLAFVHDTAQLAAVCFVQASTLEVLQAALSAPAPKASDAGISSVNVGIPPFSGATFITCDSISAKVALRNAGSNALTSCTINTQLDNGAPSSYSWTGTLAPDSSVNVTLPAVFSRGQHTITVYSSNPNGVSDSNHYNDTAFTFFDMPSVTATPPLTQGFEGAFPPTGWEVGAPNYIETWAQYAAGGKGLSAHSARLHFYNIPAGEVHDFYAPALDLSAGADSVHLTFNVAYARFNYQNFDSLKINVSTDCGGSWTNVYAKGGLSLKTAPDDSSLSVSFTPTAAQWRQEKIDLTPLIGQQDVLVQFQGISGFGNNLYIDDINVSQVVGIPSFVSDNQVAIYPNPSGGRFTISATPGIDKGLIEIYNSYGEKILSEATGFASMEEINLENVPSGFYFIRISEGKNEFVKKIIVQHN